MMRRKSRFQSLLLSILVIAVCSKVLLSPFDARPGSSHLLSKRSDPTGFSWRSAPVRNVIDAPMCLPTGAPKTIPRIQHAFDPETREQRRTRRRRLKKIKQTFLRCWDSYKARAWMQDELAPISGKSSNPFGGWAATLVDTLDTLWIMGLTDEFEHAAVAAVTHISLANSTLDKINVFETNIRYLGGLLAAYDLSGKQSLLELAVEMGEMLYTAFDTPNHFPVRELAFEAAKSGATKSAADGTAIAGLGTFMLEFLRLSQLTGDSKWFDAAQRVIHVFAEQQNDTRLPGMWPDFVDAERAILTSGSSFGLGAFSDSFYEYLVKSYLLLEGRSPILEQMYRQSMDTARSHVLFRPSTFENDDILLVGEVQAVSADNIHLKPRSQHLACFAGGMFTLGSRVFSNAEHSLIGRQLTDGCIWAYRQSPTGIMPEIFEAIPCPAASSSCTLTEARWQEEVLRRGSAGVPRGFADIPDRRFLLRPEAVESIFVVYRITGDRSLQEAGWEMFTAIERHTSTEYANAELDDITITVDSPKQDRMESFWLAETLKYFYLLYSEPGHVSLDDFVLTTEAHPLRRSKPD